MIQTGNKRFWTIQAIGWGSLGLINFWTQSLLGLPFEVLVSNAIVPFLLGFIVTSVYRYTIKKHLVWKQWGFGKIFLLILGSSCILAIGFMLLIILIYKYVLGMEGSMSTAGFIGNLITFLIILFIWNLIYFFIHYFNNWNKAEIEKWQLAAEMKDAQLGSLKSQINPHFVFNTLNNIRALILEDKNRARDMLLNFSDLFRYSLKHSDQVKVDLQEELEIVNQYLELLSIQYEDKLSYEVRVEDGIQEIQVPPMVLQLLVENAIKHGISQKKEGGSIKVSIGIRSDFLNIRVKNSGKLIKAKQLGEKLGVGLKNIQKRLDLLYNGKAHLGILEENEHVIASIKIPVA